MSYDPDNFNYFKDFIYFILNVRHLMSDDYFHPWCSQICAWYVMLSLSHWLINHGFRTHHIQSHISIKPTLSSSVYCNEHSFISVKQPKYYTLNYFWNSVCQSTRDFLLFLLLHRFSVIKTYHLQEMSKTELLLI